MSLSQASLSVVTAKAEVDLHSQVAPEAPMEVPSFYSGEVIVNGYKSSKFLSLLICDPYSHLHDVL